MIDVVIPTRSLVRAQAAVDSVSFAASVTLAMRPEWGFTKQVQAWKGGDSPFVLFLNDDCIVSESAVIEMLLPMADPKVGIVGPTLRCGDFQSNPFAAEVPLDEKGNLPYYIEVRHLIGACLLVRRSLLQQIGGWDTQFVLHCSDLDLCIRAWNAGYKVVWAVRTEVQHEAHVTLNEIPEDERKQILDADHWRFREKYPDESLSSNGVIAQRGFGKAIYEVHVTPPTVGTTKGVDTCLQETLTAT